jgi:gamma-butyrobetaine dioxygenase
MLRFQSFQTSFLRPPLAACMTLSRFIRSPHQVSGFKRSWSSLTVNNSSLTVDALRLSFPYKWLRDSCQCTECIHPSTRQKLRSTADIPSTVAPAGDGVSLVDSGIEIKWQNGHQSFYPTSFLQAYSSPNNLFRFHKDIPRQTWNKKVISDSPGLSVGYETLNTPTGLLAALNQLLQYGLLIVSRVPNEETSDDTCELRTLAERFGEIRKTFYGTLFDVKNVRNSTNIAYTNLDLGLHMDLL